MIVGSQQDWHGGHEGRGGLVCLGGDVRPQSGPEYYAGLAAKLVERGHATQEEVEQARRDLDDYGFWLYWCTRTNSQPMEHADAMTAASMQLV